MPPTRKRAKVEKEENGDKKISNKKEEKGKGKTTSYVVHNTTAYDLAAGDAVLKYEENGSDNQFNIPHLGPFSKITVELTTQSTRVDLELHKKELVSQLEKKKKGDATDGAEFIIQLEDPFQPFISKAEFEYASHTVRNTLEGANPAVPYSSLFVERTKDGKLGDAQPAKLKVWSSILKSIGRGKAAGKEDSISQVMDLITFGWELSDREVGIKFYQYYQSHPRKPGLDFSVSAYDIQKALNDGKAKVEVYYRALDRHPGGNQDEVVVKYTADLEAGVTGRTWSGFDGVCQATKQAVSIPKVGSRFKRIAVPALCALAAAHKSEGVNGTLAFIATVDDMASDSDEDDTEWSSIEVLVFLPHEQQLQGETKPVLHLLQYSVHPNWRYRDKEKEIKRIKAGPHFEQVLESLQEVFETGRPNEYTPEGNSASACFDSKQTQCLNLANFYPLYLPE